MGKEGKIGVRRFPILALPCFPLKGSQRQRRPFRLLLRPAIYTHTHAHSLLAQLRREEEG